jgi:hypothetical protein
VGILSETGSAGRRVGALANAPPQVVTLNGTGTSDTLGLCSGTLLVTYADVTGGNVVTDHESWSAPVTTFPLVTPYFVSGDRTGVGILLHHLLLSCGNSGNNPDLSFDWVEQGP